MLKNFNHKEKQLQELTCVWKIQSVMSNQMMMKSEAIFLWMKAPNKGGNNINVT